jgi:hypothetical protein
MTDIRAALNHRRITAAIDAMRAIGLDEIRAMTDEELADFRDAMSGPWMMTESDVYRRLGRDTTDTDWPDALETAP